MCFLHQMPKLSKLSELVKLGQEHILSNLVNGATMLIFYAKENQMSL